MDVGADVVTITTVLLLTSIQQGRMGVDLAIQVAGPISRYIEIKAENANVEYEMGLEEKDRQPLTVELKASFGCRRRRNCRYDPCATQEPVEEEMEEGEGLMSAPDEASPEEQALMLGDVPEEEPIEEEIV